MNRIAVVTGATGGLGRAICARLCSDGLHVVGLDIDTERLAEMEPPGFTGLTVDLTKADAIAAAFAEICTTHGGVDVLVNNAGTCFMSDFPNIPATEFDAQMQLNFASAFHCSQAAVRAMAGRPGVRKIVNISSNG